MRQPPIVDSPILRMREPPPQPMHPAQSSNTVRGVLQDGCHHICHLSTNKHKPKEHKKHDNTTNIEDKKGGNTKHNRTKEQYEQLENDKSQTNKHIYTKQIQQTNHKRRTNKEQ